jgi:hypothetical protein
VPSDSAEVLFSIRFIYYHAYFFCVNPIHTFTRFNPSIRPLLKSGINNILIDSEKNVGEIVKIYRQILDGKTIDVSNIKKYLEIKDSIFNEVKNKFNYKKIIEDFLTKLN